MFLFLVSPFVWEGWKSIDICKLHLARGRERKKEKKKRVCEIICQYIYFHLKREETKNSPLIGLSFFFLPMAFILNIQSSQHSEHNHVTPYADIFLKGF